MSMSCTLKSCLGSPPLDDATECYWCADCVSAVVAVETHVIGMSICKA